MMNPIEHHLAGLFRSESPPGAQQACTRVWNEADVGKCHDWRNHVPDELKKIWGQLSLATRTAVAFVAQRKANQEDWD